MTAEKKDPKTAEEKAPAKTAAKKAAQRASGTKGWNGIWPRTRATCKSSCRAAIGTRSPEKTAGSPAAV